MNKSIEKKLQNLIDRHEEIEISLSKAEVISDQKKFLSLSKEYSQLHPLVDIFRRYKKVHEEIKSFKKIIKENDPCIKEIAKEELKNANSCYETLGKELEAFLLPVDNQDSANVFLEIRAGSGGNEAAIFSGNLFKMYSRYAENCGWHFEVVSQSYGEQGGFKEVISKISGNNVYAQLKFESGVHRVQRIPETESQGRVHTSACTVAIMPESTDINDIDIKPSDLKINTFRASGAGGQHVNKTDSAIRITHIPSKIVVECQDQRSQHKNRMQAMSILKSKLLQAKIDEQQQSESSERKKLIGSGDRSERIRTYNYPQGRITDHRINLTLYKLEEVLQGKLDCVIGPLMYEYQSNLLIEIPERNDK